jgi:selenocysteine-specific elongation factor
MHIAIGTAGHIDHGKSTLVHALTGTTTDRLPEEKRRGITIELGFSAWDLGGGLSASVVDVPGHEGLVHTMVAGAWGLDLVLLVVAADEGVMPQTREHLAIAGLLGVRAAVVALTKVDRVDPDLAALAAEEVGAAMAVSGFPGAPVVPVSAITGVGLDTLAATVRRVVGSLSPRQADGLPFLPVDRVFTLKGFGTVVTGTLSGGPLRVEDPVDLHPGPKGLRARGLQSHARTVTEALPSWRVAVNLPGVAVADVQRGAVLCPAQSLVTTRRVDVRLHTLPESPPLKDHAPVTVHVGAAAVPGRVELVGAVPGAAAVLEPGQDVVAQVVLGRDLACRPGQRFIVRGHRRIPGQGATFGGGEILDPHPPRRRRGRPETLAAVEALASTDLATRLAQAVHDTGPRGADLAELRRRLPWRDVKKALDDAVGRGKLRRQRVADLDIAWHPERLAAFSLRLGSHLAAYHRDHPTEATAALPEVRTSLRVDGKPLEPGRFSALLAACRDPSVVLEGDAIRLASHRPRGVNPEVLARVEAAFLSAGVAPPSRAVLAQQLSLAESQVADATKALVSTSRLVRVKEDLHFHRTAHDDLVARTVAHLEAHGSLTTQEFKDLMGESRKYVIPFLEHLDDTKVTLRVGDKRVRRRTSG